MKKTSIALFIFGFSALSSLTTYIITSVTLRAPLVYVDLEFKDKRIEIPSELHTLATYYVKNGAKVLHVPQIEWEQIGNTNNEKSTVYRNGKSISLRERAVISDYASRR